MNIQFKKKRFFFKLSSTVVNSKIKINSKKGWIIKLINSTQKEGYGEIAPLEINDISICEKQIQRIPSEINSESILGNIKNFHPCIQSAFHLALAEIEGNLSFKGKYSFSEIYQTAILVNSNSIIQELKLLMANNKLKEKELTIKWKVGIKDNKVEEKILENILNQIQSNIKLRIDANGSWNREFANRWADILKENINLDWLEQPLSEDDIEGLKALQRKIPIALDESLIKYPKLIDSWEGWQIRRPSQESNPIELFEELRNKKGFRSISTSFETGIGRRILYHYSFLQLKGPTPKVPGLALSNTPQSYLFSDNPKLIWDNL